jgi:hypothetical protein
MDMRDYIRQVVAETRSAPVQKPDPESQIFDSAATHFAQSMRMHAASVIQEWAETTEEDLDNGETLADRLLSLLTAIVDSDDDLTEEEMDSLEEVLMAAEEYLLSLGVDEGDVSALLDDWDESAAGRVRDAISLSLPDGEEAGNSLSKFAFDEESTQSVFDGVYKKVVTFEHGKKVIKQRRVSGAPKHRTPKQLAQLRKARRRADSSEAKRWREVSLKKREKSGVPVNKRKLA